ncbi:DUF4399 domain-containing protein [Hansschlegelia beijingensis]|uniref:DUF4399 domain-containing protein n=1 Tax=Hansschlegelia beijingensis TaxID=1133344 RepID=A0A7W6CZW6_9HYPH|nr:DUF4399 domain-containing protein [Hansschlegelia beijingensis]MBB3971820.1 hypothetical protein [Hansschlegelia beijingensis]
MFRKAATHVDPSRRPGPPPERSAGCFLRGWRSAAVAALLLAGAAADVRADQSHAAPPHAEPTRAPEGAAVYFIDLQDGARVPLKLRVRFGLSNMGVSPAGVAFPGTGHHHLLIDAPPPAPDRPIPADDNHLHLGQGQTEADIELSPGPHTLQLVIGDKDHAPLEPSVASPTINVVAVPPRLSAPAGAEVYLVGLRDGQTVPPRMTVYFGLRGMGVAPADAGARPNSGHHHLLVDAGELSPDDLLPQDDRHRGFPDGATEAELRLPPGRHTLQLVFTDADGRQFDPPVMSKRLSVVVRLAGKQGR